MDRGNAHLFRENLVKEIGGQAVFDMEQRAKPLFKESDVWIQAKKDEITSELQRLETIHNI